MEIRGQAAIVTGGGSGLGAATAQALADAGARVTVLDANREAAEAVARRIDGLAATCDVTDAAAATAAMALAAQAHGPARLLVNCAGIGPAGRIVGRDGAMPLEAFERVIRINLIGTFNMLRLAAASMSTLGPLDGEERGVIVNTASIAAYEGQIGQSAYAASKAGVVGTHFARRARTRALRRAGRDHRPRVDRHADVQLSSRRRAQGPGGVRAVSRASRRSFRIRSACAAHRGEPVSERRDHSAGRRAAHVSALTRNIDASPKQFQPGVIMESDR